MYRVVQDNTMGYGKKILRSPEYNAGHQQGGHNTVPGIWSTKYQSCTNKWIFDTPFGTEQAERCQAPILVVACYTYALTLSWETRPGGHESYIALFMGALSHEVENCSWLINLWKSYSFILPPLIPWPRELSPSANQNNENSVYIWNNRLHSGIHVGAQLMSFSMNLGFKFN